MKHLMSYYSLILCSNISMMIQYGLDFDFDIPLQNITAVLSGIDGEIPGSNNTIQIGSEGILMPMSY